MSAQKIKISKNRRENKIVSKKLFTGKIYLINPKFQYNFMLQVVLAVVLALSVVYGANYLFFESFIEKGISLDLPMNHPFFIIINEQKEKMSQIFLFTSVIVSGILCIWGLFFSHRIAGPLYRLNKYFKDAKDNKGTPLDQIKFRKNDFFQEVPDSINEYFESDKSAASLPEVPVEKKAS